MDLPETQPQTTENVSAPPPPQEVKIRTMRSDLASMAQSGGGLPQFQNVRIDAPAEPGEGGGSAPQRERRVHIGIAIAIVGVIVVLAVITYFVFLGK